MTLSKEQVDKIQGGPYARFTPSATRYPEVSGAERARAERSAEIYGSGYLVLVDGQWRSFCGEEVRIIKKADLGETAKC